MVLSSDIILIGPVRTGKSTLGKLLSAKLGLPQVSLDDLRWKYYAEIGYDRSLAKEYRRHGGFLAVVLYWNLFAAYAVERLLTDHHNCVVDFGAAIYDSQEGFTRVRQALTAYPNVILLLPSQDTEESLRILTAREPHPPTDLSFDLNRHFLSHHTYYDLAKLTVYTKGKAPEETCVDILNMVVAKTGTTGDRN